MRRLLLLFLLFANALAQTLPPNHICRLRCIARCIDTSKVPLTQCTEQCFSYDNQKLCNNTDCWDKCLDLGPVSNLSAPTDVKFDKTNGASVLYWSPVPGAALYAVLYKLPSASRFDGDDYTITTSTQIKNFKNPKGTVCDSSVVMIMAVAASAISPFTRQKLIDPPAPYVNPALNVKSLVYVDRPFATDGYSANGTLELTFAYQTQDWPLGSDDLIVEPLFHMINCAQPDLSTAIPVPEFKKGNGNTVVGELGADMMYRQCRFMYYVQNVESKTCGTRTFIHSPPGDAIGTILMDCDSVTNAPCMKAIRHEPPACGQVDDIHYTVLNPNVKSSDKLLDLILNVTFTPIMRSNEPPTLYYVAFYGPATNYTSDDLKTFFGVNITSIQANTTNCPELTANGICAVSSHVIITDIHMDQLYGITFCAVKDPLNLTFTNILSDNRAYRPKANPIFVFSGVLHDNLSEIQPTNTFSSVSDYYKKDLPVMDIVVDLLSFIDHVEPRAKYWNFDKIKQQQPPKSWGKLSNRMHKFIGKKMKIDSGTIRIEERDTVVDILTNSTQQYEDPLEENEQSTTITDTGGGNSTDVDEDFNKTTIIQNITATSTTFRDTTSIPPNNKRIKDYAKKTPVGLIIGIVIGALCLLILGILLICIYINKRQKAKNEKFRLKITQLELEKESRYTDFPKKLDIWEIERRNLIIHNDKKLGSGAFGAVYLGKLLGKSMGHKDANSPLGVNLMRAENCQVAVKMLPEYADELSKSEFLREIGLMKTLGYHERLVNMLACITDSEPLCLVVEYCSDGDLLHFLRSRCKYMMKLDELGIDYHQPPVNDNYDLQMIITLKQLLMFAVQISYGLEYLSQKGFVHRDVAARNILVHEMNSCKIGDFGLCRYVYSESSHYKSKGGRLPLKWMSPEAIRHYEFSTQSDVWSFGILLFEIITLGGSPYPGIQPEDMLTFLESGGRMEQPDNCPDDFYAVMKACWNGEPNRPEFSVIRQKLAAQLEEVTEEYSYLKLDAQKDYYNVQYGDHKPDIMTVPEGDTIKATKEKIMANGSLSSVESIPRDSVIFDPNDDIDRVKAAIKKEQEEDTQSSLVTDSLSISLGTISDSNA